MQPLDQALRSSFGIGCVDPLILAGTFLLPQARRPGIPVIDLAVQPSPNFPFNFVDLSESTIMDLVEVRWDKVLHGIAEGALLDIASQPFFL
jgi:hypothetical protein